MPGQRLDKWLWCARLAKTRTGAARLIETRKARVNGDRVLKPSRLVQAGDVVTLAFLGRLSAPARRAARQRFLISACLRGQRGEPGTRCGLDPACTQQLGNLERRHRPAEIIALRGPRTIGRPAGLCESAA